MGPTARSRHLKVGWTDSYRKFFAHIKRGSTGKCCSVSQSVSVAGSKIAAVTQLTGRLSDCGRISNCG